MLSPPNTCGGNFKWFISLLPSVYTAEATMNRSQSRGNRIPLTSFSTSCSLSPPRESHSRGPVDGIVTLQEWQGWGTATPVPAMITEAIDYLKSLERETDALMSFGGCGGKLSGDFKMKEDKKHRATYQALSDSEKKLQFFAARQIACRLLGSRGYLCQKCWLVMEDCMCSRIASCPLWHGIRFWLYMHPKDFLRQNNTGKLLWQVFGVQAATLCLYGIAEHEDTMWTKLRNAGKSNVWFLYPNKGTIPKSVVECFSEDTSFIPNFASSTNSEGEALNFILIDGTWSNSGAMFRRLKDCAKLVWGEDKLSCISLAAGASAMHKLRPQPSGDRTCTAAAAAGLLSELQCLPAFCLYGLGKQAEALEDALLRTNLISSDGCPEETCSSQIFLRFSCPALLRWLTPLQTKLHDQAKKCEL
ncbi:hypothetical protein Nepgr_012900 [Nepenthes gracilis]|uniref:tRNA-uridine aminocarboxypropyltransferase n=1 Tax=Nepenthes gracilis TaxID=150966 RepID=A0AAD3SI46_NEPGR|nr:hypothetical protein Nepgr_012900 [Nepenthes gracilis]